MILVHILRTISSVEKAHAEYKNVQPALYLIHKDSSTYFLV